MGEISSELKVANMGFEIVVGVTSRPYRVIGSVKARVGAATVFSKTPTLEDVNWKLQEAATKMGANAVVDVTYDRGISATSWKALTAYGTAVIFDTEDIKCKSCAETIKRDAKKCRFCAEEVKNV